MTDLEESRKGYAINFCKNLLSCSVDTLSFKSACSEWYVFSIIYDNHGDHCICGKGIKFVYYIKNSNNEVVLKIGSECSKHIGGLVHSDVLVGDKILYRLESYFEKKNDNVKIDLKIIKNVIKPSDSVFLKNTIKIINEWEYKFMTDIFELLKKKRGLSVKQLNIFVKIIDKISIKCITN